MSKLIPKLDNKSLFEELHSAIEEDKRYWLRNDAKIRAVVTAKSYDEFRDTVAAAHLTPLSHTDVSKRINTWNTAARQSKNE